jgi:sterol desaturase/sphingolipid hydroxylase (fatty acid hydroxylase superfamily)
VAARIGPWAGRKYFLDKMSLRELVQAYFTHYAIMSYLALSVVSIVAALSWADGAGRPLIAAAVVLPVYPLVWYLLHRFVLHGRFLYRRRQTAALWKRVHFDHHQDPDDLSVLFGALYTTLPTIAVVTLSIGWLIGGAPGAAAALAAGLLTTCFYEFCHCIQHLPFTPRWRWLRRMMKRHLAHHFHSEKGNYGITNFLVDRILGTFYEHPKEIARSQTVFNLGYTLEEAERYPWVAALTEDRTAPGALRPARNR